MTDTLTKFDPIQASGWVLGKWQYTIIGTNKYHPFNKDILQHWVIPKPGTKETQKLAIIAQLHAPNNENTPIPNIHTTICVITVAKFTGDRDSTQTQFKQGMLDTWFKCFHTIIGKPMVIVPKERAEFGTFKVMLVQFNDQFDEMTLRHLSDMGETPNPKNERVFHVSVPKPNEDGYDRWNTLYENLPLAVDPDSNKWSKVNT